MDFGQYIRTKREEKGISARELSRRTGISQPYLSQLETGRYKSPTKSIVIDLAKGLGVSRVEPLRQAGYLSDEDYEAIKTLKDTEKTFKGNEWEKELPPNVIYNLDEILKDGSFVQYKDNFLNRNDKEKLIKFIETFIMNGDET